MMEKVLYFEGAGGNFYSEEQTKYSDIGYFRIRTSFLNNDGKQIFLDMGNGYIYDKKGKNVERFSLWIDFCFEVPKDKDEKIEYNKFYNRNKDHLKVRLLNYTKEDITKWINENLNCSFDTIEVLDYFYNYRTHGESGTYNLMENVELNHERAKARKEIYNKIDMEYRTTLNEKYSKINIMEMNDNDIVIKCHASENALSKADLERVVTIPVVY